MANEQPTIKGVFVNSHIKRLKKEKGDMAMKELEKRFGKSVDFKNTDNVLVTDEVKIIEIIVQLLNSGPISPERLAFEAGKFHFNNFATTPLAKILFATFHDPSMLMRMKYIAEHVFNGIIFNPMRTGENSIRTVMDGGVYPLDHFKGLFYAWVVYLGYDSIVTAKQLEKEKYQYEISWTKKKE